MYRHCRNLIQRPSISILSIMIGTCHTHTVREGTGDRGQGGGESECMRGQDWGGHVRLIARRSAVVNLEDDVHPLYHFTEDWVSARGLWVEPTPHTVRQSDRERRESARGREGRGEGGAERDQSRKSLCTVLIKNWEPPELGAPVFAIESVPGSLLVSAATAAAHTDKCVCV